MYDSYHKYCWLDKYIEPGSKLDYLVAIIICLFCSFFVALLGLPFMGVIDGIVGDGELLKEVNQILETIGIGIQTGKGG